MELTQIYMKTLIYNVLRLYSYSGMMVTEVCLTSDQPSQETYGSEIIPALSLPFLRAALNC